MFRAFWLLVTAVAAFGWVAARAQSVEFVDFNALRAYTGSAAHVIVDARSSTGGVTGDGGGGEFYQVGTVGHGCTAGDDDDGVIIVGTGSPSPCWYRQFWGPVHLAWYGVPDVVLGKAPNGDQCYQNDGDFQQCSADKVPRTDTGVTQNAVALAFAPRQMRRSFRVPMAGW